MNKEDIIKASPEELAGSGVSDDEMLSVLMEPTETKIMGEKRERPEVYPDFDPAPEPEPLPPMEDPDGGDTPESDVEKTLLSLSSLPTDTIVDTVDAVLTEVIVRACKIEDYEGKGEDDLLTSEQDKRALAKATERYLASKEIRITPQFALIVTFCIIYGKKFLYAQRLKKVMRRNDELEEQAEQARLERQELEQKIRDREVEIMRLKREQEDKPARPATSAKRTTPAKPTARVIRKIAINGKAE